MKNSILFNFNLVDLQMRAYAWPQSMPIDAPHWYILISMRIYVEHLIKNVSLCGQKSVELIKKSRYICCSKFWRYIYRKYNTGQNLC